LERESVDEILKKYGAKIEGQINSSGEKKDYSGSYKKFKGEISREYTTYERWANSLGNFVRINLQKKIKRRFQKVWKQHICQLNLGKL